MNPLAGYMVDAALPGDLGKGLVGRTASARAAPSRRLARDGLHAAVVVAHGRLECTEAQDTSINNCLHSIGP